jgi:iron complex transport system substrate-binding protein
MLYLLGLEEQLVGRSHECDYPSEARLKPVLVEAALDLSGLTSAETDAAVGARLASGQSLYRVDADRLRAAAPDLLVTQNLCQVCGPAGNEVSTVLATLPVPPRILWQSPRRYSEVLEAVRALGLATGRDVAAAAWVEQAEARVRSVAAATAGLPRVRVAYLEWLEPIYGGGHWIPQMLEWAGAHDANSRDGSDSAALAWEDVRAQAPEVLLVAPCGCAATRAAALARVLRERPGWNALPAVTAGRVYALDANAYFARPGPRLVDGVELLAHLVHPERCAWHGAADAYVRLD